MTCVCDDDDINLQWQQPLTGFLGLWVLFVHECDSFTYIRHKTRHTPPTDCVVLHETHPETQRFTAKLRFSPNHNSLTPNRMYIFIQRIIYTYSHIHRHMSQANCKAIICKQHKLVTQAFCCRILSVGFRQLERSISCQNDVWIILNLFSPENGCSCDFPTDISCCYARSRGAQTPERCIVWV